MGGLSFVFRHEISARLGNYLIATDPLAQADAIEVLAGGEISRCKTAAELFRQGWAPRILITKDIYLENKDELIRYGIPVLESHDRCLAVLAYYKVPRNAVEVLDGNNESTADEAQKLLEYLKSRGMRRLLVVTSNFHTRRAVILFRRVFQDAGIDVLVQATPPDIHFDPKEWWTRRRDAKTLLWEYQKLAFYVVRYW